MGEPFATIIFLFPGHGLLVNLVGECVIWLITPKSKTQEIEKGDSKALDSMNMCLEGLLREYKRFLSF